MTNNILLTIIVCVISVCFTICYIAKCWIDSRAITKSPKVVSKTSVRGIEIPKWINRTTTTKIIPISKKEEE